VNAPTDWWKDFFDGLAVDFWGEVIPPEATAEDDAFLWKHLALRPGARVLDVPCGQGRLTPALADRGCAMTGVDISERALAAAKDAAPGSGGAIRYRKAEMRDLPWSNEFDAAFCFGNSFGYLDDDGNAEFLRAVGRTLRPGGRFALDYGQSAESILPRRIVANEEADIAGFHFAEQTRYDPLSGRIENVFTFARGNARETKLASQRVYTLRQVLDLLREASLQKVAHFGSPLEEPFGLGATRLLLVAEKSGSAA
jgi:SAM-dependent methyltransferase